MSLRKTVLMLLGLSVVVMAATSTLENNVVGKLTGVLGDADAAAVWGIIVSIIGIIGRLILKRVPTVMRGIAGTIFWSIAKGIFGDGVVLSNHTDPEYLKEELKKKYPLLDINIKGN
jgi:hypothetical protein